ncbi:MAG: MarR family transcriptional regulator [Candidatus Ratteibacteria bacterium]|nr:MarR family transcriptional regulator [Candidatus Ratteibacteria bacterium]
MNDVDKITEAMDRIHRKMRTKLSKELSRGEIGEITIPQFHILEYLHNKKESVMREIADYLFVTPPAVTGLVDKLVKIGLVRRGFSPSDRRIIIVSLTSKGENVISKIKSQADELLLSFLKKLSAQERRNFLKITEKMEKVL